MLATCESTFSWKMALALKSFPPDCTLGRGTLTVTDGIIDNYALIMTGRTWCS